MTIASSPASGSGDKLCPGISLYWKGLHPITQLPGIEFENPLEEISEMFNKFMADEAGFVVSSE